MKPQLFIIRGLPGSGKSTLAKKLSDVVCEADTFFYDSEGVYRFDREKLHHAHILCQEAVKLAMFLGTPRVAVSNTAVKRWEMAPYYSLAEKYGYDVTEITISGPLRPNVHGVPQATIDRMRSTWEV